ncbi:MAG: hypothetical protein ACE5F2_00275 [Candidatus Paceibacteria bacterium]
MWYLEYGIQEFEGGEEEIKSVELGITNFIPKHIVVETAKKVWEENQKNHSHLQSVDKEPDLVWKEPLLQAS